MWYLIMFVCFVIDIIKWFLGLLNNRHIFKKEKFLFGDHLPTHPPIPALFLFKIVQNSITREYKSMQFYCRGFQGISHKGFLHRTTINHKPSLLVFALFSWPSLLGQLYRSQCPKFQFIFRLTVWLSCLFKCNKYSLIHLLVTFRAEKTSCILLLSPSRSG